MTFSYFLDRQCSSKNITSNLVLFAGMFSIVTFVLLEYLKISCLFSVVYSVWRVNIESMMNVWIYKLYMLKNHGYVKVKCQ